MSPQDRREFQRLLSALCDGDLTEEQHAQLEQWLTADADYRRQYLEYIDMHARLLLRPGVGAGLPPEQGQQSASHSGVQAPALSVGAPSALPTGLRRPVRQAMRYAVVATATLAASLLVQLLWWHPHPPEAGTGALPEAASAEPPMAGYVATLTQTADCVWHGAREPLRNGSRLQPGELRLQQGLARIRLDTGSELLLEGPTNLHLASDSAATLHLGKAVFRTDETAQPFDLHTPAASLLHAGTEYGVAVDPAGEEVHVFEGEVQRMARSGWGEPEYLKAGEARRAERQAGFPSHPIAFDAARFVRRLPVPGHPGPDVAAGLLAYEGFDYQDPDVLNTGKATGGFGWTSPWKRTVAHPPLGAAQERSALSLGESLFRPGLEAQSIGGRFEYTGLAVYYRRLATPVRLDADGVYYLSFLFRRLGPPSRPLSVVSVLLRPDEPSPDGEKGVNEPNGKKSAGFKTPDLSKRLMIGAGAPGQIFMHLGRTGSRACLPLSNGTTYLIVAKIVASRSTPEQVFVRLYGPRERLTSEEPAGWTVVSPAFHSNLVFEWLGVHVNSMDRHMIDEIRLGTTWSSVTAAWMADAQAKKDDKP